MRALPTALLMSLVGIAISTATALPQDSDRIGRDALDQVSFCAIARARACSLKTAIARGLFETGLHPRFAHGVRCRDIDSERWAIDYTYKRDRPSRHGGIDIPAPFGTPIVAAAAGTVVGVYPSESAQGINVILRHTPEDTGLAIYIYTVYAHLNKMPALRVGQHLKMGDVIGPTGNSGPVPAKLRRSGGGSSETVGSGAGDSRFGHTYRSHGQKGAGGGGRGSGGHHGVRRPALHFAAYYSASPKYAALPKIVIPADAHWMDPVALFRKGPPFDSASMRALPANEKAVPIPYALEDGSVHPAGTKLIWPYRCTH